MIRVAALVVLALALLAGASFPRENLRSQIPSSAVVRQPECVRVALRARVHDRRLATWRWEARLEQGRTATSYAERETMGCAYLRWLRGLWSGRADSRWRLWASLREPETAIRYVFGAHYSREALSVADCESHLRTWAENGQYLGLFQMGESERRLFGHGPTAIEQTRAAYDYFVRSGRDWSPWSCKPWSGS